MIIFFAINKHQYNYFNILRNFFSCGEVVYPEFNFYRGLFKLKLNELARIPFGTIVEEKCRERRVKRKYSGFFYRCLLVVELFLFYLSIKSLVDKKSCEVIVMWNGGHRYQKVISSVFKGKKRLFYFENGLLPNTTVCDPQGVNYLNSVPRDKQFYMDYSTGGVGQEEDGASSITLIPRKSRVDEDQVDLPEKYIFVPLQDDRDTQIRVFSPLFKDMEKLYDFVSENLAGEDRVFVFKEHPSSKIRYTHLHGKNPHIIFANGNSTQQLIDDCRYVMTINSTVGLESILLGKRLLVCGLAFYGIEGVSMVCKSLIEIVECVEQDSIGFDADIRKRFLNYLFNEYCVPGDWKNPTEEHLAFLKRRIVGSV